MIYTASFYDPQDWVGRAFRVSRAHPRGKRAQWDTLPFLYPSRDSLRAYRNGEMDFDVFGAEYCRSLDQGLEEAGALRDWVESAPSLGDFTLLCFERGTVPCHRRVLALWLLDRVPSLELGSLR